MSKSEKIKVGISVGDINGIGIEIILKTFSDKRMLDFCTPIIFASTKLITIYKRILKSDVLFVGVRNAESAVPSKLNIVNLWREDVKVELGKATKQGGNYAFKSLEAATEALKNKSIDVLITAPINKNTIQDNKFTFAGHTEYLESKLEGKSLMILIKDTLRVGLITGHIPLAKVASTITPKLIKSKVNILYNTLKKDFELKQPKIAILGLNPHCGDNGVIGNEDDKIIKPTIEEMQAEGKKVFGPYASDGFFGSNNYKNFDAVLAMYHDQGLAPFKALSFGEGINYTAGLNAIRTSPDHGTAFEIAGKNKANHTSFKEALFLAIQIYSSRKTFEELTQK